jgi:hypothetical protein
MLGICPDVFIVGFPRIEMAKQQVMMSVPGFTQRDQILWVKFQVRMKVEGSDMMDLQLSSFVATDYTCRLAESMLLCHSMPLRASFAPMLSGYMRSIIQFLAHYAPFFEQPFPTMMCLPPCE